MKLAKTLDKLKEDPDGESQLTAPGLGALEVVVFFQ
jgi:hypothetical protein